LFNVVRRSFHRYLEGVLTFCFFWVKPKEYKKQPLSFSFPATQRKELKERSPLPVNLPENVFHLIKQNELVLRTSNSVLLARLPDTDF